MHLEAGFFRRLNLGVRFRDASGLEVDDREIVVRLADLRVDPDRLAILALGVLDRSAAEVRAAEGERDPRRRGRRRAGHVLEATRLQLGDHRVEARDGAGLQAASAALETAGRQLHLLILELLNLVGYPLL